MYPLFPIWRPLNHRVSTINKETARRLRDTRIESFFGCAGERGMGVVIIPFDYEQLPESERKTIVPICIASIDRHGNPIAAVWFEKGVAPVQDQLRNIARFTLGDVQRVSELAEITFHGGAAGRRRWDRPLAP